MFRPIGAVMLMSLALGGIAPALAATPAADAAATVAEARKVVAENYVLPKVAAKLAAALAAGEAAGHYRGLSGAALADRMSADLHGVTADRHLSVSYDPRTAAMLASAPRGEDGPPPPEYVRRVIRGNAGVRALEVLPGNVRYLAYDGFVWDTPAAAEAIATAMRFLKDGDAIIIDLRRNGGGSPEAVAAIAAYFLPAGTPLARFEMRGRPGETSVTLAAPFSLAGKPAYVLTSGGTASAAEEFATHVSAFGFATLVGTTTAGAAFRNDIVPLPGGYLLSVSVGRPVHAKTGGDWEAKGVAPAITVPAEDALKRAEVEAMARILAAAPTGEKDDDNRLLAYYRALAAPVTPALPAAAYAGRYGDRTVAATADGLTIRRGERLAMRLIAIAPDRFVPETDPGLQFRFVTEDGQVVAVEADRGDGDVTRYAREAVR